MPRFEYIGQVASNKMQKSVVVVIKRYKYYRKYKRVFARHRRRMAHDQFDCCNIGDIVRIQECGPLTKKKKFKVVQVLRREPYHDPSQPLRPIGVDEARPSHAERLAQLTPEDWRRDECTQPAVLHLVAEMKRRNLTPYELMVRPTLKSMFSKHAVELLFKPRPKVVDGVVLEKGQAQEGEGEGVESQVEEYEEK
eukprot:TRINITY_DN6619_c0_g1_i1.p3 TRINITY_DN6619_c0_g1~~TRINITY_DN6619_c0_g1_i1.p3  ORF type:complete len:195 (-),score=18.91 TRINITY_DN6619_c0_g1_i1:265-849(-)